MSTNQFGVVQKKWLTAFILSLFLGVVGADRFYLGKSGTAVLKLITFGGLGIWALIDFIMIATKSMPGVEWVKESKDDKRTAWIVFAVAVVLAIIISSTSANQTAELKTDSDTKTSNTDKQVAKEDLSKVAKEYTLTAGYYTVGTDLPAGESDIVAVSGSGNLSSSNIFDGGINEMFGVDDGSGLYTSSFKGLKLPANAKLSLNGDLVIKLIFTKIDSSFSGRTYDEGSAKTLSSGNFTAGKDFTAGVYKIVAVSGSGNLSSSNIFDGGVNEMFGVDDGSGYYNSQFLNAEFDDKVTLTISGGLTISLIPVK